jgi:hypothetical protein
MKPQFYTSVRQFEWIMSSKDNVFITYDHDLGVVRAYDGNDCSPNFLIAVLVLCEHRDQIRGYNKGMVWWEDPYII